MALFMYPAILRPAQYTSNQELVLALGTTTIVWMTSDVNRTFFGLQAVGGNVDRMVVTLVNVTLGTVQHTFAHESGSASSSNNRFRCVGLANIQTGTGVGACTFTYDATVLRWILISKTT